MHSATDLTLQNDKGSRHTKMFKIVIVIAVVAAAAWLAAAYYQSRIEVENLKNDLAGTPKREADELIQKIGMHMVLPNETPTIATVKDVTKLVDQPFFKHAKNGDKVLMYTRIKKAILYNPSSGKVVEVAYLNVKTDDSLRLPAKDR
ncbi:MAG TPA: hypothetical protein VJ836_05125 [Candidatus Saccharimonadales bacterium]|nr:hypothetical protein [Candidatus Saccharimonadales bacterium]